MAGQNGALVLIYVADEDSLGTASWVLVGGQKDCSFDDQTAEIDLSDKLSGRLGERTPGRATASVSVELNFLPADPAQVLLKAAYRNRENILVQRFQRDDADSLGGTAIEECQGLITNLSESHPDQGPSTVSLEINLSNDWVAAA